VSAFCGEEPERADGHTPSATRTRYAPASDGSSDIAHGGGLGHNRHSAQKLAMSCCASLPPSQGGITDEAEVCH
jgi:hypothetical protein